MRKAYFHFFSDSIGASHLETLEVELAPTPYAPPAPDVFLSPPMPAQAAVFLTAPAG